MSDSKLPKDDDQSNEASQQDKWADIAEQSDKPAAEGAASEAPVEGEPGPASEAEAKAQENWEKAMRLAAELENVRKRAQRDVTQARKFALEKFANELLPVVDSLERGADVVLEDNAQVDAMREGMQLTLKLFLETLARFDIKQVDPVGETFDPHFHEAMSAQESAEHPANQVIQVLQKGYVLNERVLRPAMVVVSKAVKSN